MAVQNIIILKKDSYVAMIKNAVGSNLFRTVYARVNGRKQDILRHGDLSCAYFVSALLFSFALIQKVHVTVDGTVADLRSFGWKPITSPRQGCVIVWQSAIDERGEAHKHIGFYIGGGKAVSNDSKTGSPRIHAYAFRKVEAFYWNEKLI